MRKLSHSNVCPQCGGNAKPAFDARDVNRRISDAIFSYLRCGDCGVVYLSGVPTNLGDFYPSDYYTIARSKEELAAWSNWERYKIDIVRKFRSSGHLTEIGPAVPATNESVVAQESKKCGPPGSIVVWRTYCVLSGSILTANPNMASCPLAKLRGPVRVAATATSFPADSSGSVTASP